MQECGTIYWTKTPPHLLMHDVKYLVVLMSAKLGSSSNC